MDVRLAIRRCLKTPGFTAIVVLTLALGIGTTTMVCSVVNAVLLQPLPVRQPERVAVLGEYTPTLDTTFVSPVTFDDWATRNEAFRALAAFRYWQSVNLEDARGEPEPITLVTATANYFETLGVRPLIGRTYVEEQSRQGGREAVLSHAFWTRRYGADPSVLGKTIRVRGTAATIVGIMPPMDADLSIGWGDVWTCLYRYDIQQQRATSYRARYLTVVGRLKDGATLAQARERMTVLQHQLWRETSSVAAGYEVRVQPLADTLVGRVRPALLVLMVAVLVVLAAACANVANLMLARATDRQGETVLRLALGASRRDLVRLLLAESLVLAAAGGVAGAALAWLLLVALQQLQPDIPRLAGAGLDGSALACTSVVTLLAALVSSLAPLTALRRADLQTVLREGGRGASAGRRPRLRMALVACQTALACLLLVCGGLLFRSVQNMLQVDPGFRADRAALFDLYLPNTRYPDEAAQARFYRELMRRLRDTPGIETAGGLLYFPYKPKLWLASVLIERDPRPEHEEPVVYFNEVAGDYFAAMGIPLKAGRLPTPEEMWEAPRVALINEAMAAQLFPGRSPIGERLRGDTNGPWLEVIGIVGNVRQKRLDEPPQPEYYVTVASMPMPFFTVIVRTHDEASRMLDSVRQTVRAIDPGLAMANLQPLEAYVASRVGERRFAVTVLALFAGLTLALGAIGVYGVLSHAIARRRREIGVRLALGAAPADVRRSILAESARLVAGGLGLGLIGSVPAAYVMRGLLSGVGPLDLATYAATIAVLMTVALAAAWWPARRASRIDALMALRDE